MKKIEKKKKRSLTEILVCAADKLVPKELLQEDIFVSDDNIVADRGGSDSLSINLRCFAVSLRAREEGRESCCSLRY